MDDNEINLFDPNIIYKDLQEEFNELFLLKAAELTEDRAEKFKSLIYRQCERAQNSQMVTVPAFGEGEWLNTYRPLDFNLDLKNRIFVIDFFTYCCIDCFQILPSLKKIENDYIDNEIFTIIGIHTPRFSNEKHLESVKEAVSRYNITHPVLNDPDYKIWTKYGVYCWPTVFIVGFGHSLLFTLVGEEQIDKLPFLCEQILKYTSSWLPYHPVLELPVTTRRLRESEQSMSEINELAKADKKVKSSLLYPGSISTDGKNLAVSDTGHHRILLMSKDLILLETIGSGLQGNEDGNFNDTKFSSPNGSTWFDGKLYVADTGNHSIREIDFSSKLVTTVFNKTNTSEKFLSPWDVCIGPKLGTSLTQMNHLYIAVAGSHQMWSMNMDPTSARNCAPSVVQGREEIGKKISEMKPVFAQPTGIAYSSLSPYHIYIADSGSSTIKSVNVRRNIGRIIVGGGGSPSVLFKFGDEDGSKNECLLQHPMGVTVLGKNLLAITDTYNHKVKIIDAEKKECHTLAQPLNLREPSGLCFMDSEFSNVPSAKKLFICDTNNHRIVPVPIYDFHLKNEQCESQGPLKNYHCFNLEANLDDPMPQVPISYDGIINCRFRWNLRNFMNINSTNSNCTFEHKGDGLFKVEFPYPGGPFKGHSGADPTLRMTSNKEHLEKKRTGNLKSLVKITCDGSYYDDIQGNSKCKIFLATYEFSIKFLKSGPKVANVYLDKFV